MEIIFNHQTTEEEAWEKVEIFLNELSGFSFQGVSIDSPLISEIHEGMIKSSFRVIKGGSLSSLHLNVQVSGNAMIGFFFIINRNLKKMINEEDFRKIMLEKMKFIFSEAYFSE